jgi:hypothetical protein
VGTPGHELVSGGLDVRDGVSGTRRRRHGTDAGARRLGARATRESARARAPVAKTVRSRPV